MTHTCAHAPTRLVLMTRGLLLCTCMVAAQDARHPQQAAAHMRLWGRGAGSVSS
jgi:hypothetical protein